VVHGAAGGQKSPGLSPAPGGAAAAGAGASAGGVSQQVELLYKVLQAQQDTEVNLRARISRLRQQMEQLGIIKTDTEHQAGKALGRWAEALGSEGSDDEYGSEGSGNSEYEREPGMAPTRSAAGRFGAAAAGRSPAAAGFGTPLRSRSGSGTPLGRSPNAAAAGAGAGSTFSGMSGFSTPAVSSRGIGPAGAQQLRFVSPATTAARSGSRFTPGGSSGTKRQVTPGSASAGSSEAWRKLATELSNSTGQRASGSGRSRVRTTYATPSSSRSSGRRPGLPAPDRPSSPLEISAAAAPAAPAAASPPAAGAALFSEPFSFSKGSPAAAAAAATPAGKARVPSKLSFSPAVTPAATRPAAAAAAAGEASPALSPLWATPQAAAGAGGASSSQQFTMQANPLYYMSPVVESPVAAVPAPAIKLGSSAAGAAPAPAAAVGKPPVASSKGSQPPEPPAAMLQAAQRRVRPTLAALRAYTLLLTHDAAMS
jgi:hypothetical protein